MIPLLKQALVENDFKASDVLLKKLDVYLHVLQEWNQKINLTAHRTARDLIYKDIVDCFYLSSILEKLLGPLAHLNLKLIDMGAGAGFAGILLALQMPASQVTFLDSDRKKMNFIRQAARELALSNTTYLLGRAEEVQLTDSQRFQVAISRATWQVDDLLKHVHDTVQNNAHVLCMSGPAQEKLSENTMNIHGFTGAFEHFYQIKPENFNRKIFSFQKGTSAVPRAN